MCTSHGEAVKCTLELHVHVATLCQNWVIPYTCIYIFAVPLSSLDMLFSLCVLPIGVCKIAVHLCTAFNI